MLIAEDLTVNYGEKRVLDSISFSIQKGEILAVLGSNGRSDPDDHCARRLLGPD